MKQLEKLLEVTLNMIDKIAGENRRRMATVSPGERGMYLFKFFTIAYSMRDNLDIEECRRTAVDAAILMVGDEPGQKERLANLFDHARKMVDEESEQQNVN